MYDIMLGEEEILQSLIFQDFECFFKVGEINADLKKKFFLYYILKCVKILFLSFCMDQICVLYGKYIWKSSLFIYEKWKFLEIWYFVLQVWIN